MMLPVICDNCLQITFKDMKKIHQYNFCSDKCKHEFNSKRFSNYNSTINPQNMPGRTIDERVEMRERMLKHNQEKRKGIKTYNKYLGELEHRRLARIKIGRDLLPNEVVHHIDGNRHNNKPNNLQIMTKSEHTKLHMLKYWERKHAEK